MLNNILKLSGLKVLSKSQQSNVIGHSGGCAYHYTAPDGIVNGAHLGGVGYAENVSYEETQAMVALQREQGGVIRWCCATCEGRSWYGNP